MIRKLLGTYAVGGLVTAGLVELGYRFVEPKPAYPRGKMLGYAILVWPRVLFFGAKGLKQGIQTSPLRIKQS